VAARSQEQLIRNADCTSRQMGGVCRPGILAEVARCEVAKQCARSCIASSHVRSCAQLLHSVNRPELAFHRMAPSQSASQHLEGIQTLGVSTGRSGNVPSSTQADFHTATSQLQRVGQRVRDPKQRHRRRRKRNIDDYNGYNQQLVNGRCDQNGHGTHAASRCRCWCGGGAFSAHHAKIMCRRSAMKMATVCFGVSPGVFYAKAATHCVQLFNTYWSIPAETSGASPPMRS
jgi:hypothetical protein